MESHRQLDWRVRAIGSIAIVAVVAIPFVNHWRDRRKQELTMASMRALAGALSMRATDV